MKIYSLFLNDISEGYKYNTNVFADNVGFIFLILLIVSFLVFTLPYAVIKIIFEFVAFYACVRNILIVLM